MPDVTVLGIGRMGAAMVRRLVAAGHDVTVWNRSPEPVADLVRDLATATVRVAASPGDAVEGAAYVLAVLASGAVTEEVLLADDVLVHLAPGVVVVDLGTSGIATAQLLAARLGAAGHRFVDAPVSGSVPTVAAGQVLVMAGGDPAAVDAARPVLETFAKRVTYLGPAGTGQAMKLAVNLVVHQLSAAVSEALLLATRAGIDPAAAYDVFSDSVVAAPFVQYKRAAFLDPDTPVAMTLDLSAKDLRLILAAAEDLGVPAAATAAVAEQVVAACEAGFGAQDMAALTRFLGQRDS